MIRDLALIGVVIFLVTGAILYGFERYYTKYSFMKKCSEYGEYDKCELIYERGGGYEESEP